MRKCYTLLILLFCYSVPGQINAQAITKKQIDKRVQTIFPDSLVKAEVLLLGLFHFNYPDQDAHKTKSDLRVDILSAERQKQVKELSDMIAAFRPTKILVEYPVGMQPKLDSLYLNYKPEDLKIKRNEIYQIGFRLAKALKHPKVYAFDSKPFSFKISPADSAKMAQESDKGLAAVKPLEDKYFAYFAMGDTLASQMKLKDYILYMNAEESLRRSHSVYLAYTPIGTNETPVGADGFITRWYNRNIRMLSNVQRIATRGDRILVIVGAGHVPILQHLALHAPDLKLRKVSEFVK